MKKSRTKIEALVARKELLARSVKEIPLAKLTTVAGGASTHTCDNDAGTCDVDTTKVM